MAKEKRAIPRNAREGKSRIKDELWRLALCDNADTVRLVLAGEGEALDTAALDLRGVRSIRRTRDGLEVALYDRMEALTRLYELYTQPPDKAGEGAELLKALLASAQAAGETGGGGRG